MEERKGKKIGITILVILLLIIAIFAILTIRKVSILNDLIAKAQENEKNANYYMAIIQKDGITITVWSKDREHYIMKMTGRNFTTISYKNEEEELRISEMDGHKGISEGASIVPLCTITNFITSEFVWEGAISASISSKEYDGKECYEIKLGNLGEVIVEKETGIVLKHPNGEIKYKLNNVTDADVQKPDLTGYEEI